MTYPARRASTARGVFRVRQTAGIFDHARIASLQANHFAECITRASGSNHFRCERAACSDGFRAAAQDEHPGGKFQAQFAQIVRAFAVEDFDAFLDFERVADFAAQRLLHVGDERDDFFAHAHAGFDHQLGEIFGVFLLFHERAVAGFYVEHQRVNSLRHFFAHDGGGDQVGAFDCGGDVAQGVELFIGGRDFGGLADQGAMSQRERAAEFCELQIYVEAGDGFQFVERAAGVAEAAAADHGHVEAGRGNDGSDDERSFVADAAGGVLVHFRAREDRTNRVLRRN